MAETTQLFIEKRPQTKLAIEEYKEFLKAKNENILEATEEDILEFREHLLKKYSRANATERLLIVRDLYTFIKQRASKTQYLRYIGIILIQAFVIYSSSVWRIPKVRLTPILGIDKFLAWAFGMKTEFFVPGFVGPIIALIVVLVLIARKWFEKPKNFLGWIVMILNIWIFSILYGLIIGNEKAFFDGGITSYIMIVATTAILLGFRKIVGYAVLALIIFAGFNITAIASKLDYMTLPYVISFIVCIFTQNPEIFDRILGWINGQFLSGKAQEIGKQTAESVQAAAKTIGDNIKRAGNLNSDDVDQRLEALKNNRPKPKKTRLLD